jgi:tetratricopeptide (TPR) repeat protein
MAITPGGLRSFSAKVLNDHLPLFASREAIFTLQVSDGFSERVLYWWNGRLFILSSGERSGPGLAAHLVRAGKLDAKDAEPLLQECKRSKVSLEDALLARQVLTHAEYETAMRRLVSDELFDLVFWEDALFLSYEAPPPQDFFGAEPNILSAEVPPGQLAEDLSAWMRKWLVSKPLLKSDQAPLRLQEPGEAACREESGPASAILAACRRGTTLRELRHKVDLELADLCEHLARSVQAGLISAGDEARPALNPQQAIEKLERILPRAVGKDLVRLKLANLHKKAKRPDKACSYFQFVADEAAARADWILAADCLRSLLAIRPEDLAALRQLMKIHTDRGQTKQAIAAAMQLEQALLKNQKAEEMKAIAEMLGGISGAQLAAQEVRADLKLVAGDVERAAEEYQAIAGRHEDAGDLDRAIQVLGKAVELDGENDGLKRRLLRLKQRAHGAPRAARPAQRSSGALRSARERLREAAGWLRVALPIAGGALVLGGLVYYALQLPSGASLAVEAVVVDARRPAPPPEPARADRPRLVVKIPVERTEAPGPAPASGSAPPEPAATTPAREEQPSPPPAPREDAAPPIAAAKEPAPAPPEAGAPAAGAVGEPAPLEPPPAPGVEWEPAPDAPVAMPAAEEVGPRIPPAVLFGDALPPRPCPRHGIHTQLSRRLGGEKLVRYADDCALRIEDSRTGEVLLDLEAPAGGRWAHDPHGERVVRWTPGEAVTVFTRSPRSSTSTGWRIPADTAALAAGSSVAALRVGETTRLVRLADGVEIRSGKLPPWSHGFLDGNRLLLSLDSTAGGGRGRPWLVVDVETLAVVAEADGEAGGAAQRPPGADAPDAPPPPGGAGGEDADGEKPEEGPED